MCMFRVHADPKPSMVQDVEGLVVTVQANCCVCKQTVTLQKAGAPETVQTMNRMRVSELVLANVILQSDGKHPLEVLHLRVITANEHTHEKLHKFQTSQYQKFATGSVKDGHHD